ncbi:MULTISPECIES: hypothetical protein [Actinoalloteichus]|uniref:Uncharacterized protein n=1 Tax=Actinoalloteichus fjordicus TaxID=1612552 RepID=A0AAC9L8Y0_9PSEU|nr:MULTISPECIES: hypothetical protein [Actinoalloteichus]APU13548.1 hypothetical protein UA74_07395 [Actinoalloteichus fjordicus]APU19497.1 hypothetical protein UA75_07390 [Actinoalloteichus sp. GBA129-24]
MTETPEPPDAPEQPDSPEHPATSPNSADAAGPTPSRPPTQHHEACPARATEPMLIEQITLPTVGLICQRHAVFVNAGEPVPAEGARALALCGVPLTLGPAPQEMLPGVPAEVVDCADCQAIIWNKPDARPVDVRQRLCIRRVGTVDVHLVDAAGLTAVTMTALCGAVFHLGDALEQLAPGAGAPCTRCLLAS